MSVFINIARPLFLVVLIIVILGGCSPQEPVIMPPFVCAYEKDNAPPWSEEAEEYYIKAVTLSAPPSGKKDQWAITELYQKASNLGHWKAQYNLALRTFKGMGMHNPDIQKAVDLLETMVDNNIPLGIYAMAVTINKGMGVEYDPKLALQYMHRAANLGNPQAQYYLAKEAEKRYDFALMKQYHRCASDQGYKEATYALGMLAEIDEENYPKSIQYYLKAASLGHSIAMMSLRNIFTKDDMDNEMMGYEPDEKLAACFYEKYKALEKDPLMRFPTLATDCPIPLHPIMGDGSAYPDVELRSPGFLDRLKAAPHDPVDEAMRTARRLKMLRDDYQRNKQSAIEEQNRPPLVKLEYLPYWIEPHVQIGTFFVKYNTDVR